ncbi:MAG: ABC transporter permease [Christensenellales bacterium]|jgi:putative aldouronate transport system permease protein
MQNAVKKSPLQRSIHGILRDKWLYLMIVPGLTLLIIFRYIPIFGLRIAFMDYNVFKPSASTWVGFGQFVKLFKRPAFQKVLFNTLNISVLKLLFGFPVPIILALLLNEMRSLRIKKVVQTVLYLPHFVSWVIMAGLIMDFLDPATGAITQLIRSLTGQDIRVLSDPRYFVHMLVISDIYKTAGWGTIIYFAAISGIDPQLYEAAAMDGAKRFRQIWHITLPSIIPTIIVVFTLNLGNILNAGFEQIFMLYSALVYDVADIIDTYVYRIGIEKSDYSFSTAAGMFKSVVAFILIVSFNYFARKSGSKALW